MRITFLGHVGLHVETDRGSVLCDPWFSPAYFASWFPFPRNDHLDPSAFARPDYLYVSHLHHDHYDPAFLWAHVDKRTTVLLPAFPTDHLERELRGVGFTEFVPLDDARPVTLPGGLEVACVALTAPADGPLGDSALVVSDGRTRILDQNDARPRDLAAIEALGPFDGEFVQFSGAIWYPMVYDFPEEERRREEIRKRAAQMERALHYIEAVRPANVFPCAGPPCFLDDDLLAFNDLDGDPANIFPDQTVFLDLMEQRGIGPGHLVVPGSVIELDGPRCTVTHPVGDASPEAIFADKRAHIEAYRADWKARLEAEKATWPRGRHDVVESLRLWWEPLLEMAPLTRAGVGAPLLLHMGDDAVHVDFPAGTVGRWDGSAPYRYRFDVDRALVEWCIAHRVEDWVNEVFLSCRFTAHRDGDYNEFLYTFFKCLSVERMAFCEGWYAEATHEDEEFECGGFSVQRRCPHLRADLTRFGELLDDGTTLHCKVHGWEFDLDTGRCLTSDEERYRIRSRPSCPSA